MKTIFKIIKGAIFLFFGGVLLSSSCIKNNCVKDYEFVLPFTVVPLKDTIVVGDTLWVKADFSDKILDARSGEKFKMTNFDFETNAVLQEIISNTPPHKTGAMSQFTIVNKIGKLKEPHTSRAARVDYHYEQNHYQVKFGLIPKRKGVFNFKLYYNSQYKETKMKVSDSECTERVDFMQYYINDSDNNIHIRNNYIDTTGISNNAYVEQAYVHANYTFIVKE